MSEWTDRLAQTLGVEALDSEQQASLLTASRDIAHRVERKETPLSAYVLGVAAGARIAAGMEFSAAFQDVVTTLRELLPPESPAEAP